MSIRPLGILLCLIACGGAPPSDQALDDIAGGTSDSGDPAVGFVAVDGGAICTATLIAPHVILTGGECAAGLHPRIFYTGQPAARDRLSIAQRGLTAHALGETWAS